MTGERLSATSGEVAKRESNWDIAAALIGGTLLGYTCVGFGIYAVLSGIL